MFTYLFIQFHMLSVHSSIITHVLTEKCDIKISPNNDVTSLQFRITVEGIC